MPVRLAIRCVVVVATTVVTVGGLASEVTAKLAYDKITVSGPGLAVSVRLRPKDYLDISVVAQHSGFWKQFGCRACSVRLTPPPTRALGPAYVLTYSMPSAFGPDEEILARDQVVQYVYPYAEPQPVTFMPPHQRSPGGTRSIGGWYMADQTLTGELEALGVRPPTSDAVTTHVPAAGVARTPAAIAALLAVVLTGLSVVAVHFARGAHRREGAGR